MAKLPGTEKKEKTKKQKQTGFEIYVFFRTRNYGPPK